MRIIEVDAVGGRIWRVLDDREQKVAEFYRVGDAERFVGLGELREAARELIVAVKVQSQHSIDCTENGRNCIHCGRARRLEASLLSWEGRGR